MLSARQHRPQLRSGRARNGPAGATRCLRYIEFVRRCHHRRIRARGCL